MKENEKELRQFYDLDSGEDTTYIDNTEACLLTLPLQTSVNKQRQLIACGGPRMETLGSFWRDLVLKQGSTLIVNLCGRVGSNGWGFECCQYWPLSASEAVEDDESKIRVRLLKR